MSVWKEIRCDAENPVEGCLSHSNIGAKGFDTVSEIKAEARRDGWLIKGDYAECPPCRKQAASA